MIRKTTSNSSAVVINSASVKNNVTTTENHEELITKAAILIKSDIDEYCKKIAMNSLNWLPTFEELMSDEAICITFSHKSLEIFKTWGY